MKEELSRKKDAWKLMCKNSTVENKNRYKRMNKGKKIIFNAMRE